MLSASNLSPHTINHLLDVMSQEAAAALARGEAFTIPGIGTIKAVARKARPYNDLNNPGQSLIGRPHTVLKFRPSEGFIRSLNAISPDKNFKIPGY